MEFSRQKYWRGLLCPPPGHFCNPGIKCTFIMSPALASGFFTTSATWAAVHATHTVVHLLSCVWIFATPWTTACHLPCPSPTPGVCSNSCPLSQWSNHLILFHPLLLLPSIFPSIKVFSDELALCIRWPSIEASASTSVFPMNIQGWFPLGLTGLTSLQSRGLSRVSSNTTVQKHQFFGVQPSLWWNSHPYMLLLLLLSRVSHVRLCATP